jgi:hypothetical protein
MAGDGPGVHAAVEAGRNAADAEGMLVESSTIPAPAKLFRDWFGGGGGLFTQDSRLYLQPSPALPVVRLAWAVPPR